MSAPQTPKAPAPKAPTPAQTAKPLGSSAKPAAPKTEAAAPVDATALAQKDTVQAVEKLEIRIKAVNLNNIARTFNSQLTSTDEKLQPLHSLKTGKPIDKFPQTSSGLPKLSLTLVDAMLNALDADRTGNEEAKRERLRVQTGLRPHPA